MLRIYVVKGFMRDIWWNYERHLVKCLYMWHYYLFSVLRLDEVVTAGSENEAERVRRVSKEG